MPRRSTGRFFSLFLVKSTFAAFVPPQSHRHLSPHSSTTSRESLKSCDRACRTKETLWSQSRPRQSPSWTTERARIVRPAGRSRARPALHFPHRPPSPYRNSTVIWNYTAFGSLCAILRSVWRLSDTPFRLHHFSGWILSFTQTNRQDGKSSIRTILCTLEHCAGDSVWAALTGRNQEHERGPGRVP